MKKPTKRLAIQLSSAQVARLDRQAAAVGLTRMEMLHRILRGELKKAPAWVTIHQATTGGEPIKILYREMIDGGDNSPAISGGERPMPRVLVVEDEWLIGEDLREHLETLGATVVQVAPNCSAALEAIWSTKPDLAFVDTHLGSETCEVVLEECDRQHIPVVISTGCPPDNLPPFVGDRPVLGKPFDRALIQLMLETPPSPK